VLADYPALWQALAALSLPLAAAQPDPAAVIASLIDPVKLATLKEREPIRGFRKPFTGSQRQPGWRETGPRGGQGGGPGGYTNKLRRS